MDTDALPTVQSYRHCNLMLPCRLVDTADLSSLPVVHHSHLLKAPVTHVSASPCGSYLAAAAASTGHVTLLKLGAEQHVQLLGFVQPCEGTGMDNVSVLFDGLQPSTSIGLDRQAVLSPAFIGTRHWCRSTI
jgi:hypothetical protein